MEVKKFLTFRAEGKVSSALSIKIRHWRNISATPSEMMKWKTGPIGFCGILEKVRIKYCPNMKMSLHCSRKFLWQGEKYKLRNKSLSTRTFFYEDVCVIMRFHSLGVFHGQAEFINTFDKIRQSQDGLMVAAIDHILGHRKAEIVKYTRK